MNSNNYKLKSNTKRILTDGQSLLKKSDILKIVNTAAPLLDEITEPCLTNFDITGKNILLTEKDNAYTIEGIIDHERAFYGDLYADFLSIENIIGPIEEAESFKSGYAAATGNL